MRRITASLATGACRSKQADTATALPTTPSTPVTEVPVFEARWSLNVDGEIGRDAIAVVSDVTVDLRASRGSGRLHYAVNFGDGTTSDEVISHHTYQSPTSYSVVAVVSDDAGRVQTLTQNVMVKTLTGTWFHAAWNEQARKFERRLLTITDQEGTGLRGFFGLTSTPDRTMVGTLSAGRGVRLVVNGGEILEGKVPDRLGVEIPWSLLGHGAQVEGRVLPFTPVIGTPETPPPDAVLRITPNSGSDYPLVIAGRSRTFYDGSGSRGERLSYVIEFGDSGVTASASARHTFEASTNEDGVCRYVPYGTATLWVVDRFGRVDSESVPVPLLTVVTNCYDRGYWNWGYVNNPPGLDSVLMFETRRGDSVTGRLNYLSGLQFTGTFTGERELQLVMSNGDEYVARFDYDASGRFSHWGGPTPDLLVLTQTKGARVGGQWILVLDTYT